jgi:hypothetical protein
VEILNYDLNQTALYNKLEWLYECNGYYEKSFYNRAGFTVRSADFYNKQVKPLRTVVNRSVEWYVSKLATTMQISADNQGVVDAVNQILTWSNFQAMKPVALRTEVLKGNLFWKIVANGEKVFIESINPLYVTQLETDPRGYIIRIRIDIPVNQGDNLVKMYTEFWDKPEGYFSCWTHSGNEKTPLDQLGDPDNYAWLTELGLDFIPIVHIKFRDIGKPYGVGCVTHCLDKIDEANKMASRISQLQFRYNHPTVVVSANDKDASGRPIPSKKLEKDKDVYSEEDETILYLDGMAKIDNLIPTIDFQAALDILNAQMEELTADLPELRAYSLKDGNLSGKAVKMLLSGAISRAEEAQANFIQGLIRACQIGLTLGKYWGLFTVDGSYEAGSFDFKINTPELFPMDDSDKATMLKDLTAGGLALATSLRIIGYDDAFIKTAIEEKQSETDTILSNPNVAMNSLGNFNNNNNNQDSQANGG